MMYRIIALFTLILTSCGGPTKEAEQRVIVELETIENIHDGSVRWGCRIQGETEVGKKQEFWVSFGSAKPDTKGGWVAGVARTHCGNGSFEKTSSQVGRIFGTPYLTLNFQSIPSILSPGILRFKVSLQSKKLSGFDAQDRPIYTHQEEKRGFDVGARGEVVFPLLMMDPREQEEFGLNEVFLRLKTWIPLQNPLAAYGSISIIADIPGAEVLLDGGFVGRISDGIPLEIKNVLVGKREVRVRDFSGREVRQDVSVKQDRKAEINLTVLHGAPTGTQKNLLPLGKNPQGFEEFWRVMDKAIAVKVPSGEFLMGSLEQEGEPHERPQHRVFLSAFLIDKTEVTWRQYLKFSNETGTPLPPIPVWGSLDDYPVSNVTWEEAKAYCDWVGGRLPTEAEWEKAAKGTEGKKYPWGNEWDRDRCNSLDGGPHRPESVGSFPNCLSPYGLLDMAGSVWEWCADWYADNYTNDPATDPQGPKTGSQRVLRGACWHNMSSWLRTAYRNKSDPFWRNVNHGFRCVQTGGFGK